MILTTRRAIQHRRIFVRCARITVSMSAPSLPDTQRRTEIDENLQRVWQAMGACLNGEREAGGVFAPNGGISGEGHLNGSLNARLVAVSKLKPASDILCAYNLGQRHFGENYAQELVEKAEQLPTDIQWHFTGKLQSNKCKMVAAIPNLWAVETVDSAKKAETLNKECASRDSPLRVFVQVNTSGEESKSGVAPEECISVARFVAELCPNLVLTGLMTIGAPGREPSEGSNPDFVLLRELREKVEESLERKDLELSMGMSDDFEEALRQGSTNIRVGRTIFGARPKPTAS